MPVLTPPGYYYWDFHYLMLIRRKYFEFDAVVVTIAAALLNVDLLILGLLWQRPQLKVDACRIANVLSVKPTATSRLIHASK